MAKGPETVQAKYLAEHLKSPAKAPWLSTAALKPLLSCSAQRSCSHPALPAFFYFRLLCKKQRNAAEPCWHQRSPHFYSHLDLGNLAPSPVCLRATHLLCYTPKLLQAQALWFSLYEPWENEKHCTPFFLSWWSVECFATIRACNSLWMNPNNT